MGFQHAIDDAMATGFVLIKTVMAKEFSVYAKMRKMKSVEDMIEDVVKNDCKLLYALKF